MNPKKIIWSALLLGIGLTTQAQQATTTAGSNTSGSGGTVAYTIGQVVYTTYADSTILVAQGVQQPYIISSVENTDSHFVHLELSAYPNPSSNYLLLNVGKVEFTACSFALIDLNGKLMESRKINGSIEKIDVANLPSATYFLKVSINNEEVKTFKIIKN